MTPTEMTLNEIREKGHEVLVRELGPIGYVRFMQQFSAGQGDYTAGRHQWLDGLSIEEVKARITENRGGEKKNS